MSVIEWLWEAKKTHPTGSVKVRENKPNEPINFLILILGQICFWVCVYYIFEFSKQDLQAVKIKYVIVGLGFFLVYLLIGYIFDAKPRYDNIGLLGGMIDHPFRYSDDFNRTLIFLKVIYYPAYLMVQSFFEIVKCFKSI
ncbi:MAG: hypothetical protein JNL70_06030 [Saprospiraceae bacterium]|nr:hypothetical protein [Saprospiraceae bacterium]